MAPIERITEILGRMEAGEPAAFDDLVPLVYDELRALARSVRRRSSPDASLETTALVHEAYLKLARASAARYDHRGHFYAVAAVAMRQLLVDAARAKLTEKRGAGAVQVELDESLAPLAAEAEKVLAIDAALERLDRFDPRLRRVVECRFYGGFTEEETAAALGVTSRTVRRDWIKARGLLQLELAAGG